MKYNSTALNTSEILQLRDRFVGGDDSAYSQIYNLYAKDLYAFGLSMNMRTELIEDAIHDVFVEIYTHRKYLENVLNMKYYFMSAFRNRLFFLLKKEMSTTELTEFNSNILKETDHQQKWIEKETVTERENFVKQLFADLNDHQKEALYLRYVEGMSCEEVASFMKINYQSAKNLIHRAIKKLRSISDYSITAILVLSNVLFLS